MHPFADGNGRVARVLMNAELSAVGEQRIVIPIVYRDDYLQGLRALSRNANPRPLIRVLDFAQEYAAAIDWSDLTEAERMLEQTNAFVAPEAAEEQGLRLSCPVASIRGARHNGRRIEHGNRATAERMRYRRRRRRHRRACDGTRAAAPGAGCPALCT